MRKVNGLILLTFLSFVLSIESHPENARNLTLSERYFDDMQHHCLAETRYCSQGFFRLQNPDGQHCATDNRLSAKTKKTVDLPVDAQEMQIPIKCIASLE
uniref:Putative secreted protein n=1 Tax=Amblyomma americanum TaxID=6943 RepID=A0A0C9SCS7_AMBAM